MVLGIAMNSIKSRLDKVFANIYQSMRNRNLADKYAMRLVHLSEIV